MATTRDMQLALRAKRHGARYALRIIIEARQARIPISLGFALVEQESNFRNVYGHDPTIFAGHGQVTKSNYAEYRRRRGATGRGGMQGVGPCQLTWWEFQDRADRRGGCWSPRHNIAVGFELLSDLIRVHGKVAGIARYNGSGPPADRYSRAVRAREHKWHQRLIG